MEKLLKDKKLNHDFHTNGYVKFQLFDKDQVKEIKAFYASIKQEHNIEKNRSFHTTMNTSKRELIEKVNAFLLPYFKEMLPNHLVNYNLTSAGFLIKDPGKDSTVTIHQDLNYVDESKFSSFNLWVSMENTNLLNGCMQFIPGSHKFYPTIRTSPDIPAYFDAFKEKAADYLVDVPSQAGECVMFNQAIIHASRKNLSGKERVSGIICGYSDKANMLQYYLPKGAPLSKIELHKISVKSMIEMKKDQRPPHSEFLGYVNYTPPKVTFEAFKRKCKDNTTAWYLFRSKFINLFLGKSH